MTVTYIGIFYYQSTSLSGFLLGTTLGVLLSLLSPDVGEALLDESGDRPGPAWMVAVEAVVQPMQVVRRDVRDEAAIAIALANTGRPYRGRSLRVDQYTDGFVLDGSGTGIASVLWRTDGRDGVEVWAEEAWRPGVAEAAWTPCPLPDGGNWHGRNGRDGNARRRHGRSLGNERSRRTPAQPFSTTKQSLNRTACPREPCNNVQCEHG